MSKTESTKEITIPEPLANLVRLLGETAETTRLADDPRLLAEFVAAARRLRAETSHTTD
jgi:hypothetical protein